MSAPAPSPTTVGTTVEVILPSGKTINVNVAKGNNAVWLGKRQREKERQREKRERGT